LRARPSTRFTSERRSAMSARLFLLAALVFVALSGCSPSSVGQAKDPGALTFEGALANKYVAAEPSSPAVARLRIGTVAPPETEKPKVNLALVVDTSGSMEGQPIEDARAASMAMIDALAEGDRLAVVVFHSKAEVLLPSTPVDADNRAEIKAQLKAMKAQGTTDMGSGLQAGLDEVYAHLEPRGINRVVLLGDGVPNEEGRIRSMASEAGSRGVTITALGLGLDYNESLMGAVAQASGGRFHYIERSEEVASFFKEEVLRLKRVVGRNASLKLSPGPGVVIKGVVGLPTSMSGTDTMVTLGDMSEGDQRDVIVRVAAAGRRAGSVVELFDAAVAFDVTNGFTSARLEERSFVAVRATGDAQELASGRDADVERTAARMSVADRIVQAIAAARMGQLAQAQAMLDAIEKDARRAAKELEDDELLEKAKTIPSLKGSLSSLVQRVEPALPVMPVKVSAMSVTADSTPTPQMARPAAQVVMEAQASAVQTIQGM